MRTSAHSGGRESATEMSVLSRFRVVSVDDRAVAYANSGVIAGVSNALAAVIRSRLSKDDSREQELTLAINELERLSTVRNAARSRCMDSRSLVVLVTQRCNLSCFYCYGTNGEYGSSVPAPSTESVLSAIDRLSAGARSGTVCRVTFFGGEPLLNLGLIKAACQHCVEIGNRTGVKWRFSVTTNGTISSNDAIRTLKQFRFGVLISFDGVSHESSRRFRSGRSSAARVESTMTAFADAGVAFDVRATVLPEIVRANRLLELLESCDATPCRRVLVAPVDVSRREDRGELAFSDRDFRLLIESYRQIGQRNLGNVMNRGQFAIKFDPYVDFVTAALQGRSGRRECGAFGAMRARAADGQTYPCHRFVGRSGYEIGTDEAVDLAKVAALEKEVDSATIKCDTCAAWATCGSRCFNSLADRNGLFNVPNELECEAQRQHADNAVEMFVRVRTAGTRTIQNYVAAASRLCR